MARQAEIFERDVPRVHGAVQPVRVGQTVPAVPGKSEMSVRLEERENAVSGVQRIRVGHELGVRVKVLKTVTQGLRRVVPKVVKKERTFETRLPKGRQVNGQALRVNACRYGEKTLEVQLD